MVILFILSMFLTFIVVRISAHLWHDRENYGNEFEKSRTVTFLLRKWTKKDLHHIHIGLVILLMTIPFILFKGFVNVNVFFLAAGISMVID